MVEWHGYRLLESVRERLAFATAISAFLTVLGSLICKSARSVSFVDGTGAGWKDGVKPWALWAFLGGLAILILIGFAAWTDRWTVPAIASIALWVKIATGTVSYRDHLEASFQIQTYYAEQNIADGMYVVPIGAIIGAICAGFLAIVSTWMHFDFQKRMARSVLAPG